MIPVLLDESRPVCASAVGEQTRHSYVDVLRPDDFFSLAYQLATADPLAPLCHKRNDFVDVEVELPCQRSIRA